MPGSSVEMSGVVLPDLVGTAQRNQGTSWNEIASQPLRPSSDTELAVNSLPGCKCCRACSAWCMHNGNGMCDSCCAPRSPATRCFNACMQIFCKSRLRCAMSCMLFGIIVFILCLLNFFDIIKWPTYASVVCKLSAETTKHGLEITDGTCGHDTLLNSMCYWNRGPTRCIHGRCVCPPGFCTTGGSCILRASDRNRADGGAAIARVVSVNSTMRTFPGEQKSVKTAVLFSGGGMRSLSLTLGALRALEEFGVIANVDAISAVSGGAWGAAIYMFANINKQKLLGAATSSLSTLSLERLSESPGALGAVATTPMKNYLDRLMLKQARKSEMWEMFVSEVVLKPVDLHSRAKPMASSEEDRNLIISENPALSDVEFMLPQKLRPKVFVMVGALLAPEGVRDEPNHVVSLQMSPDFVGSPFHPDRSPHGKEESSKSVFLPSSIDVAVGGGLVESFAFGGNAPRPNLSFGNRVPVRVPLPPTPMTLVSALAISSCAGAASLVELGVPGAYAPQELYWPVPPHVPATMYKLGDGGLIDNSGLLPMLQRGATGIVWFINTDTGLDAGTDFCNPSTSSKKGFPYGMITNQLYDKFGYGTDSASSGYLSHNQVFAKHDFMDVACNLQRKKQQGKPAVYKRSHRVLGNDWWGILGGHDAEVLYMYHEFAQEFADQLPKDTRDALGRGEFSNYPFFKTMFQNGVLDFTQYSNRQVNILAAIAEYASRSARSDIESVLSRESPPVV